ncbi:hypothetical protein [Amycolatopsis thermophila]|uniref:Uncharacterized protein n=1 Tax=Amycolatopsis thermophila TaxID=206084 RepID=A0ABU0F5S8_9PSEU|nr:hypothetical protein [Amycolatopsis thermophila]MDQ0382689.1 hypothetical protein [Amycolatopsis thermophila]
MTGALTASMCAAMTAHGVFTTYVLPTDFLLAGLQGFLVRTTASMLLAQPEKPDDADTLLRRILVTPMLGGPATFMRRFGLDNVFGSCGPTECGIETILDDPGRTRVPSACRGTTSRSDRRRARHSGLLQYRR